MADSQKSPGIRKRVRFALLGGGLRVLARSINKARGKDPWLDRALRQFEGVWRFESGDRKLYRHLILEAGKFRVSRECGRPADFTFTIYSSSATGLRARPDRVLEVLIANKIGQSGDLHYLYQFGFIMSLYRRTTLFKGKSIPIEGRGQPPRD